jgi:hypothetical protein
MLQCVNFSFAAAFLVDRTVGMDADVTPTPSSDNGPRKFFVAGVEVEFPVKPYKCQISTMNMVRASIGIGANYLNI